MNRGREQKRCQPNPFLNASILSKLTFWWLKPMFSIGLKRAIQEDDIYAVKNDMRSDLNTKAFAKQWELECKKRNPSLFRILLKMYLLKVFIIGFLLAILQTVVRLLQPICLGRLVAYFTQSGYQTTITLGEAYAYATGIVLSTAILFCTFHPYTFFVLNTSCKMRMACSGLIYRKSLRILKASAEDGQNGKIINILSSDLPRFDTAFTFAHEMWEGPIQTLLFLAVIYWQIGLAGIIGVVFLLAFSPLQAWISKRSGVLRLRCSKRTDFRVRIMNEILHGIQVIKMYAWEKSFAKMVDKIRKKEVAEIRSIANIQATIHSLSLIPKVALFLSLISYVLFGNPITASQVFIVSSFFNILEFTMFSYFPVVMASFAEGCIAVKRVQEFLLQPESKKIFHHKRSKYNEYTESVNESKKTQKDDQNNKNIMNGDGVHRKKSDVFTGDTDGITTIAYSRKLIENTAQRKQNINTPNKCIRFENVTAVWEHSDTHQMNGIFDMNVEMKPGLCAIVGPVGSCKSTLLNIILGELELDSGSLAINGSISYASQEPWLFESSVRDNIIFVEDFDEQRYSKVVEVCALERDFKLLPQGDATIVGEKGSSLSGGQKARVNLARAIYKQSDIYLLDDPLSAVDTHVGKHIFERCIEEFLADKVCVLVTHQLQYLKNVDHVILIKGGRVEAEGPFKRLEKFNKDVLAFSQGESVDGTAELTAKRIQRGTSEKSTTDDDIADAMDDRKELQVEGSIKFSTYTKFFKAVQSNVYILVVFALFTVSQCAWSGADYFLAEWVNWEERVVKMNKNQVNETIKSRIEIETPLAVYAPSDAEIKHERNIYLFVYTSIMVTGIAVLMFRAVSFYRMCLRISINLHDMIFRGVTRAKMIFFNNNPSGRILNRFARDINNVDSLLPNAMFDVIDCFLRYLAIIVINVIVNPWLLIPAALMTVSFYLIRLIFINTGRSFKRIEALSRSPIFSHVNATLQGLTTVRSCNASKMLEKEFHEFQDHNTSCFFMFNSASRWFALWLDIIMLLFSGIVTYSFLILRNTMESGQIGLAILSNINLINLCQYGMRQSAELENQMTSIERIMEYAELPSEPPLESNKEHAPPETWPQSGNIEFKLLSLRYTENGHRVLRNLTFRIDAKQKIGVVGRTGAGKSSIIQSLFRLAENDGQIFIDGIDIGVIGLHDLRKKISIIPQEPVLFSGSLRFNLDPFEERSDAELWNVIDQVELTPAVSSMPGGIDGKVLDGGSNFSVGQRQLLCLARAILRNNKILVLDEATANVDSETDNLVQQTIRRQFIDCTVITIAHRLNTVMDSDKVLVVDAGEIVEYDHPYELIKADGYFKQLLDQTGDSTASALTLIAKENYERFKSNS